MQDNYAKRDQALKECIIVTPNHLVVEHHAFQEKMITLSDLKEVFFSMEDDKTPRCDGFPCEFYRTLWDYIGPNFHKVNLAF